MRGLAILLLAATAFAQQPGPQPANLTSAQQKAIRTVLVQRMDRDKWCDKGEEEFVNGLTYENVAVSNHPVILVSPSSGCARSGQGANSELWLFSFVAEKPRLIGSPADGLQGWWNTIDPHVSHGFHDITLGWHMGAAEFTAITLRFDGTSYKVIRSKNVDLGN